MFLRALEALDAGASDMAIVLGSLAGGVQDYWLQSPAILGKGINVDMYTLTLVARMAATVKLDEARKNALDRFLASLLVQEGVKVSLQEALGLMVDYSLENRDQLIKRIRKLPPLEEDPAWMMLEEPDEWGVEDASERIDEYLYGE
jgi:hypothetical protein